MNAKPATVIPWLFLVLGLICAALIVQLFVYESDYYLSPVESRILHPSHPGLRPAGRLGLLLGIAGTALMVINLSYLVRKRLARLTWLGAFRSWMAFHVFTGLIGPALIVLHSGLVLRSPLASLAFVAMLVVVTTGIIGRSIYGLVPRSIEGKELELADVKRELSEILSELRDLGLGSGLISAAAVENAAGNAPGTARVGLAASFLEVILAGHRLRAEYRELRRRILRDPALRPLASEILPLARKLCRVRRWHARYHQLRRLMGAWRFFHRWLAIVMLVMVLFHVVIGVRYGELWIFRDGP